jgi:hypothetical protein
MALIFLTCLAGGMLCTMAAAPVALVSARFVRTGAMISLALVIIPLAWIIVRGPLPDTSNVRAGIVLGIAALLTAASIGLLADHPRRARTLRILVAIAGAIALFGSYLICRGLGLWPLEGGTVATLSGVNFLLSAAVLGTVTLSWLLGHAYLTAADMTLAPLRRLGDLFAATVGLRCVFAGVSIAVVLLMASPAETERGILAALGLGGMDVIYLAVRVGVGLLPLPILAWMTRDCIKARNTQSTTGVLYFTSVFAYVGELSSLHLMAATGLAL